MIGASQRYLVALFINNIKTIRPISVYFTDDYIFWVVQKARIDQQSIQNYAIIHYKVYKVLSLIDRFFTPHKIKIWTVFITGIFKPYNSYLHLWFLFEIISLNEII